MSTTFAVYIGEKEIEFKDDKITNLTYDEMEADFLDVAFRYSNGDINYTDLIALLLADDIKVYAMDNTQQGIYTIGDINKKIKEQLK